MTAFISTLILYDCYRIGWRVHSYRAAPIAAVAGKEVLMKKPRVLVVDDQQNARITMRVLIEDLGAHVQTAEDGYQAIEGARKGPFDLAFIDIEMPGINGIQTLRELLKLRPEMMAAMVTGYGEARLVKEALNEGAVAVLLKPFDAKEVSHLVRGINWRQKGNPRKSGDVLNAPNVVPDGGFNSRTLVP